MQTYTELVLAFKESLQSSKKLKNFAFSLEYEILGIEIMPVDYFNFYCFILEDIAVMNSGKAQPIIFALYNDFEKLTDNQQQQFLKIIKDNAHLYKENMTVYFLADILARKIETKILQNLLKNIDNDLLKKSITSILKKP